MSRIKQNISADSRFDEARAWELGRGRKRDYGRAMRLYRSAAARGSREAAFNLGVMLERGMGVTESRRAAMIWYRKAAVMGDCDAAFRLGHLFDKGERRGPANAKSAESWYRRAATQGHVLAHYNLALLLEAKGGKEDLAEAARLYRFAARHGDVPAMCNLGVAYLDGRGVRKSISTGRSWLRRAALGGDAIARGNLSRLK